MGSRNKGRGLSLLISIIDCPPSKKFKVLIVILPRNSLSWGILKMESIETSDKIVKSQNGTTDLKVTSGENCVHDVEEGKTTYSKLSVTLMVVFSGLAIGSDGFNSSIIGNLSLIFGVLYPDLSATMYSRLSNAFLVGMIVGMLGFGYVSDRLGRKSGAVLTTFILVLGIALSAASSGKDQLGMFWMLVIARGIAGVGAGG